MLTALRQQAENIAERAAVEQLQVNRLWAETSAIRRERDDRDSHAASTMVSVGYKLARPTIP